MIIRIYAKCDDRFNMRIADRGIAYDGYPPKDLPIGDGDGIILEIESTTGQIVNWSDEEAAGMIAALDMEGSA